MRLPLPLLHARRKDPLYSAVVSARPLPLNFDPADRELFAHELHKSIPPTLLLHFENCRVASNGLLFKGIHVFEESFGYRSMLEQWATLKNVSKFFVANYALKKKQRFDEEVVLFVHNWSGAYFHWLTDALPRLYAMSETLPSIDILLPEEYASKEYTLQSLLPFKLKAIRYLNKNSGDCVNDAVTHARLPHLRPDLDLLADYLLGYYRRLAIRTGMAERVLVGDLPFQWNTDFDFPWMGGWLASQEGKKSERDVITVIPGRNRSEAIIMADHYDTAYMEDIYGERPGIRGDGSRLAARGADDNHSATAALMLGARIFVELSRKDRLDCDIWLVHLTGEEFPADCLGARALTQKLVERTLQLRQANGLYRDLSKANVRGVYVLDMIAHNNEHERDIFQISPGTTKESLWLAYQAHEAATAWAAGTKIWNRQPLRQNLDRGRRSLAGDVVPLIAQHLALYGEVRLHSNPRSTLFNTDGQIFSDAGLPTVLFMENYDINREGYHDSHDTMGNIDLDYGAAVAAIAIEAVARAASQPTI